MSCVDGIVADYHFACEHSFQALHPRVLWRFSSFVSAWFHSLPLLSSADWVEGDQTGWEIVVFAREMVVVGDEPLELEWERRFEQIERLGDREVHLSVDFHRHCWLLPNCFDPAAVLDVLVTLPHHRLSVQYDGDWSDRHHCHARQKGDDAERLALGHAENNLPSQTWSWSLSLSPRVFLFLCLPIILQKLFISQHWQWTTEHCSLATSCMRLFSTLDVSRQQVSKNFCQCSNGHACSMAETLMSHLHLFPLVHLASIIAKTPFVRMLPAEDGLEPTRVLEKFTPAKQTTECNLLHEQISFTLGIIRIGDRLTFVEHSGDQPLCIHRWYLTSRTGRSLHQDRVENLMCQGVPTCIGVTHQFRAGFRLGTSGEGDCVKTLIGVFFHEDRWWAFVFRMDWRLLSWKRQMEQRWRKYQARAEMIIACNTSIVGGEQIELFAKSHRRSDRPDFLSIYSVYTWCKVVIDQQRCVFRYQRPDSLDQHSTRRTAELVLNFWWFHSLAVPMDQRWQARPSQSQRWDTNTTSSSSLMKNWDEQTTR